MTYPPQPPDPYGQQYPPPPPQPGYGQQYPPPNPYQQPYPQQPPAYPQQPPYGQFGQQPPGLYPGGVPPRPPRSNVGKVVAIMAGAVVLLGLAIGGVVWFNAANASQTTVSVATSTTHRPSTTTSHRTPSTTRSNPGGGTGSGGGGAPAGSPQALADAFAAAVNHHDVSGAVALVCATDRDGYQKVAQSSNSIFGPNAQVTMTVKGVQQSDSTHASASMHTEGTVNGEPGSKDTSLPMVQQGGNWAVCGH